MLAPVVAGGIGMAASGGSMAPPSGSITKSNPPIFGQSAKINIESSLIPRAAVPTPTAAVVPSALGTNSFAALANVPGSTTDVSVNGATTNGDKTPNVVTGTGTGSTQLINTTPATTAPGKSPTKQDKVTDIDALKKKLAMMERETSRLR